MISFQASCINILAKKVKNATPLSEVAENGHTQ